MQGPPLSVASTVTSSANQGGIETRSFFRLPEGSEDFEPGEIGIFSAIVFLCGPDRGVPKQKGDGLDVCSHVEAVSPNVWREAPARSVRHCR